MIVIGAGMAGLLAASIMRNQCERIIEAQDSLPSNHSAVLRFRSPIVGDTCNIPFKKVKAIKSYIPWKNKVADVMAYSDKTNGDYRIRSIVTADGQVMERYVAPSNFTELLVKSLNCPIEFGHKVSGLDELLSFQQPIISTLPMPLLMSILKYPEKKPEFRSIPGVNLLCLVRNCNMYASLYIPDPLCGPYRVSINGDQLISEVALLGQTSDSFIQEHLNLWYDHSLSALGIPANRVYQNDYRKQPLMKILPIDEDIRQRFIIWATDNYGIYSLGRFATWRPNILLDDVVNDVRVIQRIVRGSNYDHKKFQIT